MPRFDRTTFPVEGRTPIRLSLPCLWAFLILLGCGDAVAPGLDDGLADNSPPRFTGSPPTRVEHDLEYIHHIQVSDPDGDPLSFTVRTLPNWLTFDPEERLLSGTPGLENLGGHRVDLEVSDGRAKDRLTFVLSVVPGLSSLLHDGSWNAYWTYRDYGHDGHPYESENFLVYGDFVSQAERRRVAEVLEVHHCTPSQVMENRALESGSPAASIPGGLHGADVFAVSVEHPRDDLSALFLKFSRVLQLDLE